MSSYTAKPKPPERPRLHRVRTARFAGHLGPSSNPARQLQRQQRLAKKHPDHLTIGLDLPSISDTQSGVGLGQGSTSIDENSTRVAHKSMGVTLYAQRPLPHQLAVQLIAGLGQTSFDNQRYAQTDNTLLGSERKAQGWHASLGVSHTSALAADIIFQPYARLSYMAARFDSTQESGSGSANAVAMDTLHTRRQSLTAGATLSKTITTANALKWTPFVGVQWQQANTGHIDQGVSLVSQSQTVTPAHWDGLFSAQRLLNAGVTATSLSGMQWSVNLQRSTGSDPLGLTHYGAHVSWPLQ